MSHSIEAGPRLSAHALREALREEDRLRQAGALMADAMAAPQFGHSAASTESGLASTDATRRADEAAATPDGDRAAGRRDKVRNDLIDGA